uniref:Transmembrane protein n=1 Tax=Lepeophtheirus salmonis TaxID=72036 RepID=A0A0K2US06_LEPSM
MQKNNKLEKVLSLHRRLNNIVNYIKILNFLIFYFNFKYYVYFHSMFNIQNILQIILQRKKRMLLQFEYVVYTSVMLCACAGSVSCALRINKSYKQEMMALDVNF